MSPHDSRSSGTDWLSTVRLGAVVSLISGLCAYLLAKVASMEEQSIVLAVILVVSTLAWLGVFERPTHRHQALRVRTPVRHPRALHDTMQPWDERPND